MVSLPSPRIFCVILKDSVSSAKWGRKKFGLNFKNLLSTTCKAKAGKSFEIDWKNLGFFSTHTHTHTKSAYPGGGKWMSI